jgi:hypothetical protein
MFAGPGLGLGRLTPDVVVHEDEGEGDRESDMRFEPGTANAGDFIESSIPLAREFSVSIGWVLEEKRAELRRR